MLKRMMFIVVTLALIFSLIPGSVVAAKSENSERYLDLMRSIPGGVPYTIYYTDQGNIREIKLGVPDGFKVEEAKNTDSIITPKSTGTHNCSFRLSNTNRTWRDTDTHMFAVNDRQWQSGFWSPDQTTSCFSGVYNVAGDYAVGANVTSPYANLIIYIATAGNYRTQFTYYGFTTRVDVELQYFPWW